MGSVQAWNKLDQDELAPGLRRRMLSGDRITIARFEIERGAVVPEHSHDNEQMSCVLEGALRFIMSGQEFVVRAGEVLHIPSNAPHATVALEDSLVMDVFAPPRYDWIRGDDSYFKSQE